MPNFDVRDGHGSIITIESSVVGGANRQVVTAAITTGNSSVMLLSGAGIIGSVTALQGTSPWNIAGSVLAVKGTWSGSVLSQQLGTRISSIVNSIPSSLLTGTYGHRNDSIASFLGGNLSWNPIATDSAGR